jgi:predicted amidohydrolase YtcJ
LCSGRKRVEHERAGWGVYNQRRTEYEPEEIKHLEAALTVVDGKVVYDDLH